MSGVLCDFMRSESGCHGNHFKANNTVDMERSRILTACYLALKMGGIPQTWQFHHVSEQNEIPIAWSSNFRPIKSFSPWHYVRMMNGRIHSALNSCLHGCRWIKKVAVWNFLACLQRGSDGPCETVEKASHSCHQDGASQEPAQGL